MGLGLSGRHGRSETRSIIVIIILVIIIARQFSPSLRLTFLDRCSESLDRRSSYQPSLGRACAVSYGATLSPPSGPG